MLPRLLILDNAVHRRLFHPARHWRRFFRGTDVYTVNLPGGFRIPTIEQFTHLLITGSEASITRPPAWLDREVRVIRCAVDHGLVVLGSCFGFQALARALSGDQAVRRSDTPEIGWIPLHTEAEDELLAGVPDPWTVFSFHLDEIVDPPPPWRVLATSPRGTIHAARYGDRPIWGLQAHPEISPRQAHIFAKAYLATMKRTPLKLLDAFGRPDGNPDAATRSIARKFIETPPGIAGRHS